ncbi:unnamed protein product [Closterium sp. NIES-53]
MIDDSGNCSIASWRVRSLGVLCLGVLLCLEVLLVLRRDCLCSSYMSGLFSAHTVGVELPDGAGADGTSGVGCAGAGDPTEPGAAGAGGAGAGGAGVGGLGAGGARAAGVGVGGTGARGPGASGAGAVDPSAGGARGTVRPRSYFVPLLQQVLGVPSSTGLPPPFLCPPLDQLQPPLQPSSPLPAPSPHNEQSGGLRECREPASCRVSPVRTARRAPRLRSPPVPGMYAMALRPSFVPLRVPLPAPPDSSLPEIPDPAVKRPLGSPPAFKARYVARGFSQQQGVDYFQTFL